MSRAHIHVDIDLPQLPQIDPSQIADQITRQIQSFLRSTYPALPTECWLDDITEPTPSPEPKEWEVTCMAMEQWTRTYQVKAKTESEAIQYAREHGVFKHEEFIETESVSDWKAKPCNPLP